jgi:hypothetical protein
VSRNRRVVVISDSASLAIGLSALEPGWEVRSQGSDATSITADVVVIDVGGIDQAMRVLTDDSPHSDAITEPGRRPPAVVIGELGSGSAALPPDSLVLSRPFTLSELTECIDGLLRAPRSRPPVGAAPTTAPARPPEVRVPPSSDDVPAPGRPRRRHSRSTASPRTPPSPAPKGGAPRRSDQASRGAEQTGEPLFPRQQDRGPTDEVTSSPADVDGSAAPMASDALDPDLIDLTANVVTHSAREDRPEEPGTASEGELVIPPAREVGAAEGTATDAGGQPVQVVEVEAGVRVPAVRRWFSRYRDSATPAELALRERLQQGKASAAELEELVAELPLLASPAALASVLVEEIALQSRADTVGLWRPDDQVWRLDAHQGFTAHEAGWSVPADHPLFAELRSTGGALLLTPVDMAQAAIAGIAGAHTRSFMAAAVGDRADVQALIAVGCHRDLTRDDLDGLIALADELAPGLAVSRSLERLRLLSGPTVDPEPTVIRRSWQRSELELR